MTAVKSTRLVLLPDLATLPWERPEVRAIEQRPEDKQHGRVENRSCPRAVLRSSSSFMWVSKWCGARDQNGQRPLDWIVRAVVLERKLLDPVIDG